MHPSTLDTGGIKKFKFVAVFVLTLPRGCRGLFFTDMKAGKVTNMQTRNLNLNQHANLRTVHIIMWVSLCTTVVHCTAQNGSDYFPS